MISVRRGLRSFLSVALATLVLAACGGGGDSGSEPTPPPAGNPPAPEITQQPESITVPEGVSATFSVAATAREGTLSYEWQRNGTAIPGANASSYTTSAATEADQGASFTVVVSASNGTRVVSRPAVLTVQFPPRILTQPQSLAVQAGQIATFRVVAQARGRDTLTFQWQRNGVDIVGAVDDSYTLASVVAGDSQARFTVVVTSSSGVSLASEAATLTVNLTPPPQITQQPQAATVVAGASAQFTVAAQPAAGATLSYQWRRNGAAIAGATGSSYTTPATTADDDRAVYSVQVNGSNGASVVSNDARLSVNAPPVITTQPSSVTVLATQSATFSVAAALQTGGVLSYQWYRGSTPIQGATAATYSTAPATLADNGAVFTVEVRNTVGSTTTTVRSDPATLTVGAAPIVSAQPQSVAAQLGQTVTFAVTAQSQGGTLSYQWRRNGAAISGATAASYVTPPITEADNGALFSVVVASSNGTSTVSANATLTVNLPPSITAQPQPAAVALGQTATFTVTAQSQGGTLSYQWRRNGTAIAGATTASHTTPAVAAGDDGAVYSVVVSSSNGTSVVSAAATLTVNLPPTISAQPAGVTVNVGQTAAFSVTAQAQGGTLSYQWRRNGVAISGATGASYTTPAVVAGDNGAAFSVVVSSSNGTSVTSAAATLTVNLPPTISTQPASVTVTVGQTAAFAVTAQAPQGATLSYQWRKNGAAIAGATTASYTTPATVLGDNGAVFSVVVSASNGTSVTSAGATLTVNQAPAPVIASQPQSLAVTAGQNATFSVTATSQGGTLSYQWRKNGTAIAGATTASYTTPATTATDDGAVFSVLVSSSNGASTASANAVLTVNVPPAITAQPASVSVAVGQTATFNVTAQSQGGTLSYQWRRNGVSISGANTASYTTPATVAGDNGAVFSVLVSSSNGTSTASAGATLTVNAAPLITAQPQPVTVNLGQTATFVVTATSQGGTLSYQWRRNGVAVSGANTASYTTPAAVAGDNGATFSVVVSSSNGTSTTSASATLSVNLPPGITTQPQSTTVNVGQTATFSVTAQSQGGTLSYQWRRNGTAIAGANAASYTTPAATAGDNGAVFSVLVSSSNGTSAASADATLTVNLAPTISSQPQAVTVNLGQTASFGVTAASQGGTLSYQWRKNGLAISGATTASYTTPATVAGDNGARFSVVVSSSNGTSTTSANATLTVNVPPSITTQPQSVTVNVGQTATFSVTAQSQGGTLSYQWRRNGTAIAGATAASYTTPAAAAGDNGATFSVLVSSSNGTNTASASATLTVNVPPTITTQPQPVAVNEGQSATFSVVATGSAALSYQWLRGGLPIAGATQSTYTTAATALADNGAAFSVVVTSGGVSVTSSAATLTVNAVMPAGYRLLAEAGPQAAVSFSFAESQTRSYNTAALLAVNSANPAAGSTTVEPAGTALVLAAVPTGTVAGERITTLRNRYSVYLKGGRLYRFDHDAPGGATAGQLLSTLGTADVCLRPEGSPETASAFDLVAPERSWFFARGPGADGTCYTFDDVTRAVRLNMAATDAPVVVPGWTVEDIRSANGGLAGHVFIVGTQVLRRDAELANPTNLFTLASGAALSSTVTPTAAFPGIWVFVDGTTVYAVNLASPATRTSIATLASGEALDLEPASDGSKLYVAISGATDTRVIAVTPGATITAAPVGSVPQEVTSLGLTPTRIILGGHASVVSLPKAGGAATSLFTAGAFDFSSAMLTAGENVYWAVQNTGNNTARIEISDSAGANRQTLANTTLFAVGHASGFPITFDFGRTEILYLASPTTGADNQAGATLSAFDGRNRTTLVTYGALPASPAGEFVLDVFDPVLHGEARLFTFRVAGSTANSDLYHIDTDTAALNRVTSFGTTAAAGTGGAAAAQRASVRGAAVRTVPPLQR